MSAADEKGGDEIGAVVQALTPDRRTILLRLGLTGAVLSVYFYWYGQRHRGLPEIVAIVVVFGLWMMWPLLRLMVADDAIVITDRGLVDHTGGVAFVAWHEIREAHARSYLGLKVVELDLPDPEPVLRRMSPVRRMLLRHYLRAYKGRASLKASYVQGGAEALLRIIRERIPPVQAPAR